MPTTEPTARPTLCVDYIDKCGQWYGGCFASTSPFPTFTKPSCSLETTKPPVTTTVTPAPTPTRTVCVDYINKCGQTYGGCFPSTSPFPTFTGPSCSLETTTPTVTTIITRSSTTTAHTATPTICVDYINKCGQTYGGCFPSTSPFPTFTAPSCSLDTVTTSTITPKPTTVTGAVPTVCVDSVNSCGRTYGGCFPSTRPFPTFSDPGCP